MPNMGKQWQGFPARQALQSLVNVPVFIANDARMATLGEYTYGNHPASRDMLMVTVGTGIGGGLVLDGKLRLGTYGAAGELGHHVVLIDGPECSCGGRGCLEAIVSGPALARRGAELVRSGQAPILSGLVDGRSQAVTTREMAIAARAGDKAVAEAIRTCARYLGIGIANAISIAAVDRVVLTGGVVSLGDLLLDPVRIAVREHVRMFPPDKIEIVPSTLGENTGALGCVAFAAEQSRD
jgi:glucokinase